MMTNINIKISEKHIPLLTTKKRWVVCYGGRNSGKSVEIAMVILIRCMKNKERVLVCRETKNSTDTSVHAEFVKIIEKNNLPGFTITKTQIMHENGSTINFTGLLAHTVDSIKSFSNCTICWVEEAASVSEDSWRKLQHTIREENSQIFVSFNPWEETDWIYKKFVLDYNGSEDALIIKSSYKENPFISQTSLKEIELLKKTNIQEYLEDFEGVCRIAKSGTPIYSDLFNKRIHILEEYTPIEDKPLILGFDFGETRSAWVCCQEDSKNRLVILSSSLCIDTKTDKLADDCLNWITSNLKNKYIGIITYADVAGKTGHSAATQTDYDILTEKGLTPLSDQRKGLIVDGINVVRKKLSSIRDGLPELLVVDNKENKFLINSFMGKYSWVEMSRSGEVKRRPLHDDHSHIMDALRYICINKYQINSSNIQEITSWMNDYEAQCNDWSLF